MKKQRNYLREIKTQIEKSKNWNLISSKNNDNLMISRDDSLQQISKKKETTIKEIYDEIKINLNKNIINLENFRISCNCKEKKDDDFFSELLEEELIIDYNCKVCNNKIKDPKKREYEKEILEKNKEMKIKQCSDDQLSNNKIICLDKIKINKENKLNLDSCSKNLTRFLANRKSLFKLMWSLNQIIPNNQTQRKI